MSDTKRLEAPTSDLGLISRRPRPSEISTKMDSPTPPSDPSAGSPISIGLPGPAFLRHYARYDLLTWQPRGSLDDVLLDQIADWLVSVEKEIVPLKRFVDFSQLKEIAIRTRHVLEFARKRAEQFRGTAPVRTSLFSDQWIGFGIARLYESLMENTLIEARAFQDRKEAAKWLDVPAEVLELKDEPVPSSRVAPRTNSPAGSAPKRRKRD